MRTIKVELKNAQGDIVKGVILETEERHWKSTWSEEDTEMYINVASSLRGYACGLENEEHKKHIKKELDWLENRFKSLLSQPMQEWSEEDEKTFWGFTAYIPNEELERLGVTRDDILKKLKSLRLQPIQLKEAYKEGFQTARHATALAFMNYLDENRPEGKMCLSNSECEDIEKAFLVGDWEKIERYFHKYQQNPSWSEKDEKMRNRIIDILNRTFSVYSTLGTSSTRPSCPTYKDEIDWLKSLRPQPKAELTLLDKNIISAAVAFVDLNPYNYWCGIDKRTVIKALRSLRPSWKPSEEDIKMLEHIIGQYETGNKNSKVMGYLSRVEELSFLKNVLSKWKN